MTDNPIKFDAIGVSMQRDPYGKYSSFLVFFLQGARVHRELIKDNRTLAYALKDQHDALDKVALGLSRGKYQFVTKGDKP